MRERRWAASSVEAPSDNNAGSAWRRYSPTPRFTYVTRRGDCSSHYRNMRWRRQQHSPRPASRLIRDRPYRRWRPRRGIRLARSMMREDKPGIDDWPTKAAFINRASRLRHARAKMLMTLQPNHVARLRLSFQIARGLGHHFARASAPRVSILKTPRPRRKRRRCGRDAMCFVRR